jgi:uncharacterized membrane protein required for colicin V production
MAYILDLIIVAVILVTVFLGYRRGFIRTIIQLIGCVVAFALALSFSATVSTYIYDDLLRDGLHEKIETVWNETVIEGAATSVTEQVESVLEELPSFVSATLDADTLVAGIRDTVGLSETGTAVADYLVDTMLRPVIVAVLRFVSFLILYLVFMLLIRLLEKLLTPLIKLPLIRQTDGTLGAVLGLLKGIVFALVAVTIMQLVAAGATSGPCTQENLENSLVAGWLAEINPISSVLHLD